jgi:hypothetical protein
MIITIRGYDACIETLCAGMKGKEVLMWFGHLNYVERRSEEE